MTIRLHSKLGVNPHLTYCPRCGGETNEIALLGTTNKVYICNLGHRSIGYPKNGKCPECNAIVSFEREIEERERIPGGLCDNCQEQIKEVKKGGIFFRCKCGTEGVIKAGHPLAEAVRKQLKVKAPKPCGVELETCPNCEN